MSPAYADFIEFTVRGRPNIKPSEVEELLLNCLNISTESILMESLAQQQLRQKVSFVKQKARRERGSDYLL